MSSQTSLKVDPEFVEVEITVRRANGQKDTMTFPKVKDGTINAKTTFEEESERFLFTDRPYRSPVVKTVEFWFDPVEDDGIYYTYTVDTPQDSVVG